jgi:hypothetical protein
MNLKVDVLEHIYTTDFYQRSAFNPEQQIISIYYLVKALEPLLVPLKEMPFDFDEHQQQLISKNVAVEAFRFVDWEKFSPESVSLPIDKVVAAIIKEKY